VSLLHREKRAVDLSAWITGSDSYRPSTSGERVNSKTAMSLSAVSRAVSLLADMASTLPLDTFRQDTHLVPRVVSSPQLVSSPSMVVSQMVWRHQLMVSWLLFGNAYGLVLTRDRQGWPTTIEWIDPSTVAAAQGSSLRRPSFQVNGVDVNPDEFFHIPGKHVPPGSALGVAPLERHKETFGLALAARSFGSKWFGDGAHPSAVLSSDQVLNQEQATAMKTRFLAAVKGRREPAVLGAGLTYTPIQSAPDEAQFLETQAASVGDIARAFDLPPEAIGGADKGSSVTYANREQRSQDLLTFGIDPYLTRIETDLYTENLPRPLFVKFNRAALLRSDTATRYQAHDSAIRAGWKTRDEVRALEDLPPIPDGSGAEALWPPYSTTPTATQNGK